METNLIHSESVEEKLLYTGRRLSGSNLVYRYIDVSDGSAYIFKKQLLKVNIIGSIIIGETTGNTFRSIRCEGCITSSSEFYDKIKEWRLEDRSAYLEQESRRSKPNIKSVEDLIDEVKDSWVGMTKQKKMMISRYVFEKLTNSII